MTRSIETNRAEVEGLLLTAKQLVEEDVQSLKKSVALRLDLDAMVKSYNSSYTLCCEIQELLETFEDGFGTDPEEFDEDDVLQRIKSLEDRVSELNQRVTYLETQEQC